MSSLRRQMQDRLVCECLFCEMPINSDLKMNTINAAANKGENTIPRTLFRT